MNARKVNMSQLKCLQILRTNRTFPNFYMKRLDDYSNSP